MNGDHPAFPLTFIDREGCTGMTYRQWLAGMALCGMMARPDDRTYSPKSNMTLDEWLALADKQDAQIILRRVDALIATENVKEGKK